MKFYRNQSSCTQIFTIFGGVFTRLSNSLSLLFRTQRSLIEKVFPKFEVMESVCVNKCLNRRKGRSKMKTKSFKLKSNFTAKNAERERSRVKSLRHAFQCLQSCLPSVPPNTKLSKLDILILATNYISYLTKLLSGDEQVELNANTTFDCDLKFLHPIKKWPMRSRLYSISESVDVSHTLLQDPTTSMQSFAEINSYLLLNT